MELIDLISKIPWVQMLVKKTDNHTMGVTAENWQKIKDTVFVAYPESKTPFAFWYKENDKREKIVCIGQVRYP